MSLVLFYAQGNLHHDEVSKILLFMKDESSSNIFYILYVRCNELRKKLNSTLEKIFK